MCDVTCVYHNCVIARALFSLFMRNYMIKWQADVITSSTKKSPLQSHSNTECEHTINSDCIAGFLFASQMMRSTNHLLLNIFKAPDCILLSIFFFNSCVIQFPSKSDSIHKLATTKMNEVHEISINR